MKKTLALLMITSVVSSLNLNSAATLEKAKGNGNSANSNGAAATEAHTDPNAAAAPTDPATTDPAATTGNLGVPHQCY